MARKRSSIPNAIVKQIVERDGSANCHYCGHVGESKLFTGSTGRGKYLWIEHEIDHVIPIAAGGSDELDNLVIACRKCNNDKRAKLGWEYGTKANDRPKLLAK